MKRVVLICIIVAALIVPVNAYDNDYNIYNSEEYIDTTDIVNSYKEHQNSLHEQAEYLRSLGGTQLPFRAAAIAALQDEWLYCQEWVVAYTNLGKYTFKEWRILATVIFYEAGYCPTQHQEYVGQVVLNRVNSDLFSYAYDIEGIVSAPKQYNKYYTTEKAAKAAYERDEDAFITALCVARRCLMGLVDMPENVVYQSEFKNLGSGNFYTSYVDTGWFRSTTYFNYA